MFILVTVKRFVLPLVDREGAKGKPAVVAATGVARGSLEMLRHDYLRLAVAAVNFHSTAVLREVEAEAGRHRECFAQ